MAKQHEWLANCGYQSIETAVNQENIAMAQVNLGSGFEVCGVRSEPHRVQVIFSKQLR
jgi:hypothetical protein